MSAIRRIWPSVVIPMDDGKKVSPAPQVMAFALYELADYE